MHLFSHIAIVGKTGFFRLGTAIGLGEVEFHIQTINIPRKKIDLLSYPASNGGVG